MFANKDLDSGGSYRRIPVDEGQCSGRFAYVGAAASAVSWPEVEVATHPEAFCCAFCWRVEYDDIGEAAGVEVAIV